MKPFGSILMCGLLAAAPVAYAASPGVAKAFSTEMADIVERVMPAVVVVQTEAMRSRLVQDWFFGQMYKVPERLAGQGSGVVISKDGYILTNRHVIDGAQRIQVAFSDGSQFPAELIGDDPSTDLAVLKIVSTNSPPYPHLQPGDSDALRVGEFVLALGSPFSLDSSVTLGIVSGKGRSIGAIPYGVEDFIQTDAAVNRGNSGGPLVDLDGRLIGINTLIQTSGLSEGNIGISFAIPVNLAMRVADSIIETGSWSRPWIGIRMDESPDGVAVAGVVQQSPADKAGLRLGDVIVAVNNRAVDAPIEVQRSILGQRVGEPVELRILRNGREERVKLRTEAMPAPARLVQE